MKHVNAEKVMKVLNERPENQPFALLGKNHEEIGRGIKFKGKLRLFGKPFGDEIRSYTDFELDEYPKVLEEHNVFETETLKYLYSPDINEKFIDLLCRATNTVPGPVKELLKRYEDYYAFTNTTYEEILNHKIKWIGSGTASKMAAIMTIAKGEF